jgi:hypothetical protein
LKTRPGRIDKGRSILEEQMAKGKKTGGRRPGSPNRDTTKRTAYVKAAIVRFEAEVPEAFIGDAVAFMQLIYRDPNQELSVRLDAAKAASRFERPTLAATLVRDMTPTPGTPAETDARIQALLMKGIAGHVAIDAGPADGSAGGAELGGED